MKKKGKLEEIMHSMSQRSPNLSYFRPSIYSAKNISSVSNKVNQTPKVAQEWKSQRKPLQCRINLVHEQDLMQLKKNRVERVPPFQSLMNSRGNHKSVTVSAAKSIDDAHICGQISNKCTKPSVSQHIIIHIILIVDGSRVHFSIYAYICFVFSSILVAVSYTHLTLPTNREV